MKNKEEKYSQIPNEIIEALAQTHLSSYENRYIWFLLRKTFGFHKKKDYISNSQFVKGTGITKQHIWHTKKRLLWRKIVAQIGNKVGINKNWAEWRRLPKSGTVAKNGIKVADSRKKVAQIGGDKRKDQKKLNKRKRYSSFKKSSSNKGLTGESLLEEMRSKDKHPFYDGEPMRWSDNRWKVIPKDGGDWLEFAGEESEIEWK